MIKEAFEKALSEKSAKDAREALRARALEAAKKAASSTARQTRALSVVTKSRAIDTANLAVVGLARAARAEAKAEASPKIPGFSTETTKAFKAAMARWEQLGANAVEALREETLQPSPELRRRITVSLRKAVTAFAEEHLPGGSFSAGSTADTIIRMETWRVFPGLGLAQFAADRYAVETGEHPVLYSRYVTPDERDPRNVSGLEFCSKPENGSFRLGNRRLFKPVSVTRDDVLRPALLMGAQFQFGGYDHAGDRHYGDGFSWCGHVFFEDDARQLTFNGESAFVPTNLVGLDGAHRFSSEQSALVAVLAAGSALAQQELATDSAKKAILAEVIERGCSKLLASPELEGDPDDRRMEHVETLYGVAGVTLGRHGIQVLDDRRLQISPVLLQKENAKIDPAARCRVAKGKFGPCGRPNGKGGVDVSSTDEAKGPKRVDMDAALQLHPVMRSVSNVAYRGVRGHGTLVETILGPTTLPLMCGGPGGAVQLTRELGNVLQVYETSTLTGTSFGLKEPGDYEAFKASLPKVGDLLGETLAIHGAPTKHIRRALRGAEVVSVRELNDGTVYRNVRWVIRVRFVNKTAAVKIRGAYKAMVTRAVTSLLRKGEKIQHTDLLRNELVVSGWEHEMLLASMDAFKGTGKGNARFRVEIAVETLRYYLPEVETEELLRTLLPSKCFRKGAVVYREDFDKEGCYQALVEEFQHRFAKTVSIGRTLTQDLWEDLLNGYTKGREINWSAISQNGVTGKSVALEISKGITGRPEVLVFTAYDNGRFSVVQETTAFKAVVLLKAEHASPRVSCKAIPVMLEVAYAAKAMEMPALARFLEQGGRERARGVNLLFQLVKGEPVKGRRSIVASNQFRSSYEGRLKEAVELRSLIEGDLLEWPADLQIHVSENPLPDGEKHVAQAAWQRMRSQGRTLVITRELLSVLPNGGPQWEAVKGLLEGAMAQDWNRMGNNFRVLKTGLQSMLKPSNKQFYKKLHEGTQALHVKRVPVFGDHAEVHESLCLHPHGESARTLAKQVGCEPEDLEGQWVIAVRAPMFLPVALRVKFNKSIDPYQVGVSDLVMSVDNGDADGDTIVVVAITCPLAIAEISAYPAIEVAKKIHASTHTSDPFHWVDQNMLVDGKQNVWAKVHTISYEEVARLDAGTINAYRYEMPKDANRAHLMVAIASMAPGMELGYGEFDILSANGMMFSVYEAELGGYSAKFSCMHEIFKDTNLSPAEKTDKVVEAAKALDLKEDFARTWLRSVWAKSSVDKMARTGYHAMNTNGEKVFVVPAKAGKDASLKSRFAPVARLVAQAMKFLSQGSVGCPLMMNLDRAEVEVTLSSGEKEVYKLMPFIRQLADAEIPGAIRLCFFAQKILPSIRGAFGSEFAIVSSEYTDE